MRRAAQTRIRKKPGKWGRWGHKNRAGEKRKKKETAKLAGTSSIKGKKMAAGGQGVPKDKENVTRCAREGERGGVGGEGADFTREPESDPPPNLYQL
jgi:hypothetical protein